MKMKTSLKKTMEKVSFVELQEKRYFNDSVQKYKSTKVQKYKIKNDKMECVSNVNQLRSEGLYAVFILF